MREKRGREGGGIQKNGREKYITVSLLPPTSVSSKDKVCVGREGNIQLSVAHEVVELNSVNDGGFCRFLERNTHAHGYPTETALF